MDEATTAMNLTDVELTIKYPNFFARLRASVKQAVIASDLDGVIIYWKLFAEELYGWRSEEVTGRNIIEINTA